jgi:hypothetical protein
MKKVFARPISLLGESPLNRYDPKSEQYSLDLLKRVNRNFQIVWRHRSELGFVPVEGTLFFFFFKIIHEKSYFN